MQKNPPAFKCSKFSVVFVLQLNARSMALKFIWRLALDEYIAIVTMTAISIVIAKKKKKS